MSKQATTIMAGTKIIIHVLSFILSPPLPRIQQLLFSFYNMFIMLGQERLENFQKIREGTKLLIEATASKKKQKWITKITRFYELSPDLRGRYLVATIGLFI